MTAVLGSQGRVEKSRRRAVEKRKVAHHPLLISVGRMGPHAFIECQILVAVQAEKVTHSGDGVLETLWRPLDRGQISAASSSPVRETSPFSLSAHVPRPANRACAAAITARQQPGTATRARGRASLYALPSQR